MSARWWIAGPSIGPLHTTLASGRIGARRYARMRGRYWPNRFRRVSYWLLGVWALEAWFWIAYGAALLLIAGWRIWEARSATVRARRATI